MAGEFDVARRCIAEAMQQAEEDQAMSVPTMGDALLHTLLTAMLKTRTRKDLASLIDFQLDSAGEDEFGVTRGS